MGKKQLLIVLIASLLVIYGGYKFYQHWANRSKVNLVPPMAPADTTDNDQSKKDAAAGQTTPSASDVANANTQAAIQKYTDQIFTAKGQDQANAYYQRGLLYLNTNQFRSAIDDFTNAIKLVDSSANLFYNRALAYDKEDMNNEALSDLGRAIYLNPKMAAAYNVRGLLYVKINNLGLAAKDYQAAIAIDPNYDQAYFNYGTLLVRQNQYKEAVEEFSKAISANVPAKAATPGDVAAAKQRLMQAYLQRATTKAMLGDFKNALVDATYVVTADPKNVDAYKLRAQIYDKMGNNAAAASDNATADGLSIETMMNHQ